MTIASPKLLWLQSGEPFPPPEQAWGQTSPAPGLLVAGGMLNSTTLLQAYSEGIFPWFSEGQPVLWWSTEPRMVLRTEAFVLHRSLRKKINALLRDERLEIRVDTSFSAVIKTCANTPRQGQGGTWISADMVAAYCSMHAAGHAHSVETWIDGALVAGLYCVAIGKAVFGESMFTSVTDGSKIALAALVALCRIQGVPQIDCQQVTAHLASLGAAPISREAFLRTVRMEREKPPCDWAFRPVYWDALHLKTASNTP
jgi:leucyl/phenylalanyl-tRNA---protein transferase